MGFLHAKNHCMLRIGLEKQEMIHADRIRVDRWCETALGLFFFLFE